MPHRRGGRGWDFQQGRVLTRAQLAALLAEIPEEWRDFFELLAVTGLRVSEAIALRWEDLEQGHPASLQVRRSIVKGVMGAPKSRVGRRLLPIEAGLAERLARRRPEGAGEEESRLKYHRRHAVESGQHPRSDTAAGAAPLGVPRVGFHASAIPAHRC